jgi:putative DNA primase/helicase
VSDRANMLAAALRYAGAGIGVFPVNGHKEPLTGKGGFHHATTDREQIEKWWTKWPEAGIATPDFDVVDVDLYKPECKPTWEQIRPLIPEGTPQTRTTRGGLQFIFAAGTLHDGKIGPGADNRYAGRNYVLLPPSRALGGKYEAVVDVVLKRPKPAPDFPRISGTNSEFNHLRDQMDAGEKITDGRNKAAWWQAVKILRTLPATIDLAPVAALVQSWANANCAEPLDEVDVPKQVRGAAKFVKDERNKAAAATPRSLPRRPLLTRPLRKRAER